MNSILLWRDSLLRHWVAAAFAFALVVTITAFIIVNAPREYRSVSRLLLRVGPESATLDPTVTVTGDTNAPLKTREDEVETAIDIMRSRSTMEEVIDRLGTDLILKEEFPGQAVASDEEPASALSEWLGSMKSAIRNIDPVSTREKAVRALEQGFDISAAEKSSLVTIEYKSGNPKVAQTIVSEWVEAFLAHHAKVNRTQGAYAFFLEQDAALSEQLDHVQRQIREAKSQAGLATLEGQQRMLEAQLETVGSDLFKVEADLVESAVRAESYEELLAGSIERTMREATTGIESEARNGMRGTLFQLEVLENEYAARYKESHPKLIAIRAQLAEARKIVDAQQDDRTEYRETINPTHQQIFEKRIVDIALEKSLRERKKTLEQQREHLIAEINALNEHEENLSHLKRKSEILQERQKAHAVLLEQSRLNEALEEQRVTSINIVQPATLEERPVSPDKKLCAMAGLVAAFAFSLGIPVLLDWRRFVFEPEPRGLVRGGDLIDEPRAETSLASAASSTTPILTESSEPESVMHAAARPR